MNESLQTTEIGNFPSEWEINRVDSAVEIQQGKQVSRKNRERLLESFIFALFLARISLASQELKHVRVAYTKGNKMKGMCLKTKLDGDFNSPPMALCQALTSR